jgi:hypothetical protein
MTFFVSFVTWLLCVNLASSAGYLGSERATNLKPDISSAGGRYRLSTAALPEAQNIGFLTPTALSFRARVNE